MWKVIWINKFNDSSPEMQIKILEYRKEKRKIVKEACSTVSRRFKLKI